MSNSFFRLIWRFNALAIAAVSALGILIGLYSVYHIARDVFRTPYETHDAARIEMPSDTAKPGAPASAKRIDVQAFSRIPGTPLVYGAVHATQAYDFRYSSKEATSTRNYLIYDTASGASRTLLPDDQSVISAFQFLTPDNAAPDTAPLALAALFIDKDANGDGMLNHNDGAALALARPDGTGLTRIADGVDEHLGWFVPGGMDGRGAVALIRQGNKVQALHVDFSTFKVMRTDTVAP